MSSFSDTLGALKNVLLLQDHMIQVRQDIADLTDDVDDLNDYVVSIDKRVVRIETMIEMSQNAPSQKRLEE
ncbi:MAG: hypothetical protein AAGH53_02090 [Pseudomonadota bacterium]